MAKAGTFAAYKQLQPTKDLSRDLQYWNDVDARTRAQDFQEEQFEEQKADKDRARKDKLREQYGKYLQVDKVGSKSLDAKLANVVGVQAMGRQRELLNKLLTTDPNTPEGIDLALQLESIQHIPEKLKAVNDILKVKFEDYKSGVDSNKYWRDPEFEQMWQNGFEDAVILLDENNQPVLAFEDTNQDGVIDLRDQIYSYDDIVTKMPTKQFIERYDIDEDIQGLFKDDRVPISTIERVTRFGESEKIVDLDEERLSDLTENRYYNSIQRDEEGNIINAEPSKMAISHMVEMGLDLNDMNNVEVARENYSERIRNSVSKINEEKENASAKIAASREARLRAQETEQPTLSEPVESTETNWGDKFEVLDTTNYLTVPIENQRTVGTLKSGNETLTNAKVTGYSVDKNDHIVVTVEVPRTKQATQKDITELQKRVDNTEEGTPERYLANEALSEAKGAGTITIPGQTERVSVILPDEDVQRSTGLTKQQAKERARRAAGETTNEPIKFN